MTRPSSPLVSIVTPVLNRASTIRQCLASVEVQTHADVEHIVIDGGSTDGTVDILRDEPRSGKVRWTSEPDEGLYDAINKGLSVARGDVLAFLPSDDHYLPWSVEVAVEALSDDADVVYGDLGLFVEGAGRDRFELLFYPPFTFSYYTHVGTLATPTTFWTRSLLNKIGGFDKTYRLIADCDYWLRAAEAGGALRHVDEVLAVQVDHDDTLRTRHAALLDQEFARLRTEHGHSSRAPRSTTVGAMSQKLMRRRLLVDFYRETKKDRPERWKRFIDLLRSAHLGISPRAIALQMLPAAVVGHRSVIDADRARKVLGRSFVAA